MCDCFPIVAIQFYLLLRTLSNVKDVQSRTEHSLACFIPDTPADLKFEPIKDILVNGDFGVTFSMVSELIESDLNAYIQKYSLLWSC